MPIEVTLSGSLIELSEVQPLKAESPIEVTPSGIIVVAQPAIKVLVEVSIIALQLFLESNTVFPSSTIIEVNKVQPLKADSPIDITLFPIITEVKDEQLEKAYHSIDLTLSGITIEVKEVQPLKAESPIEVTLSGIIVEAQPKINLLVEVSIIALQLSLLS